MEEKANNNKKKKLFTIVLVFAVVLAVTATTWCHQPSTPATPRIPDLPSTVTSKCTVSTAHFASGCELLKYFDTNNDGKIDDSELDAAASAYSAGSITADEYAFVVAARAKGSINALCPGCYT